MDIGKRLNAFVKLGSVIQMFLNYGEIVEDSEWINFKKRFDDLLRSSHEENPWFIEKNVRYAFSVIAKTLKEEKLAIWIKKYQQHIINRKMVKKVGVVLAGNIPLVGFFDFMYVLISGNSFIGKLSSKDRSLLPFVSELLISIEPAFEKRIEFIEEKLTGFDAIIATGSNNSARYFKYYFGRYPNIVRKNRNGVGVLSGNETRKELLALGKDMLLYFGLGCRNVSKIYVPDQYSFEQLFDALKEYSWLANHNKYMNNHDYYKSIYLIDQLKHFDNGVLILKEDKSFATPISIVHYEYYTNYEKLNRELIENSTKIQCIVANTDKIDSCFPYGTTQDPGLGDYADGIDTMKFLLTL